MSAIQTISRDILNALKFLKHYGVIHCDLKPENILLIKNESNFVKLIDFGSAMFVTDTDIHCEM
jgi:serine/threonine protein kinase